MKEIKEITVTSSPLRLNDGVVRLTDKQAAVRAHCLRPHLDGKGKPVKGCYEIVKEICFKVGETFGYDKATNLRSEPGQADAVLREALAEKDALIADMQTRIDELEVQIAEMAKTSEKAKAPQK